MRLRTLGAVCATCAAAVPASPAVASDPPAPAQPGAAVPPATHASVTGAVAPASLDRPLVQRMIDHRLALQRVHYRLHGDQLTRLERSAARIALARLTPAELHARNHSLHSHVRRLLRNAQRRSADDARHAPIPNALSAIAHCESGGDPHAVSASGTYRGKYQFDRHTWSSVGGSGDPAAAPEAEQDRRAARLYARSGATPWPVCGH